MVPGIAFEIFMLAIFFVARITGILELEAFAMYGALIGSVYLLMGGAFLKTIWFPLVYLAFSLPPPDSVVAAVTQPIKIAISEGAVSLLHSFGYPVASTGVQIQIAQYELLVAAACAGLNSIVTLSALCLFYVYLRHRSNPVTFVFVCLAVIPIAMFANFVRVLILILITYYLGEAAAQGRDEVLGVSFEGVEAAHPASGVLEALTAADVVVLGPSNPFVSIGPVLAVPGVRDALATSGARRIAVSPVVGGRVLKGPAAHMLSTLGHDVSALGVARLYAGLVDVFVVDEQDAHLAPAIRELGMAVHPARTVMGPDAEDRARFARDLLAIAAAAHP